MQVQLTEILDKLNTQETLLLNRQTAIEIKMLIWESYDPYDNLIFPTRANWDKLLTKCITRNSFHMLDKDETLSILFGLIHRTRIVDGLWWSMFERGVIQKLLTRLQSLDIALS